MASNFGVSFLPGQQEPMNGNGTGGRPGIQQSPMQQAVKILSLRLPKFYGSGSIAPGPLLTSPGGMGQHAARGNVAAQAFAQMAGLPPTMAPVPPTVPTLGGIGGTDTFDDWARNERGINGRAPQPAAPGEPPAFVPPPYTPLPPVVRPGEDEMERGTGAIFDTPQPEPTVSDGSPWERPGRNESLMRKYLEMLDQYGSA